MERAAERNIPDVAVARVSAVLGAFDAHHTDLRLSEISRRAGLPKSTTSRLVAELVAYGLLDRSGTSLSVGTRMAGLGRLAAARRDLRDVALPLLADLRAATGQTVLLAVLDDDEVVTVEVLGDRTGPRVCPGRSPAHASAAGKALLAWSDDTVVDRVCGGPLTAVGPRTVTAPGQLRRQLGRIRDGGLAYECEESAPGVGGVAGAVLRPGGHAVAAVAVTGWAGTLNLRAAGPAVRTVALVIGRECGA
jgi:DNA-binding IclR family transcriptional regulator